MRNFLKKAAEFMQGRYGHDKLNTFIWILAAAVYVINLFVRSPILVIVILLLGALAVFRSLSKNITKRLYENNRFVSIYTAVADFFKRQYMKVRDFKTHRYLRCPYCKAQLRLKKRTGVQSIHCPRCGADFKKNILF
ncbi:MAG: hypothetical protein IJH40_03005 [Ruminococcus sp.]|uniref:hypothetical protein n=1 Tax=Ruminococcus sp. TaxID=41978 RepID=UPI002873217A|nr:hypothetical protein [Ruminococcus sp.]MBQ3284586.1 hypothetical protein [Ruminococcus sp.]